jgi:hypothetical protein
MRRFSQIVPVIALSACVRIGGYDIPITPLVPIALKIRSSLTRLRNDIPARRARLRPIRCGMETCYSREDVLAVIAKIRRDARAAFPDEALATRLTLDEELARVQDRVIAFRGASSIFLVRNAPDNSAHLVRAQEVDATFQRAQEPIDTLLAHRELNPTLRILSEPDRAKFQMLIGTNKKTTRETSTQNDLESVWRGRYIGTIRKKGYREVDGFVIDLFLESKTTIRCRLVPNTAPQNDQSTCNLEN